MCTISVNVNESEMRSFDPMLTDTEAITRWVQLLVDSTVRGKQTRQTRQVSPLVSSLFTGHKAAVTDEQLEQMKNDYLMEKVIVTRNVKDYAAAGLPVMTPGEFLA